MNAGALLLYAVGIVLAAHAAPAADRFALPGDKNIVEEEHFGLAQGMLSTGIPYRHIGGVQGIWSPPWVSSDFAVTTRINGETWATDRYTWRYGTVDCTASNGPLTAESEVTLIPDARAGILCLTVANNGTEPQSLRLEWAVAGTLDETPVWEFARPQSQTATAAAADGNTLSLTQGRQAIVIRADTIWQPEGRCGATTIALKPGERQARYLCFAIGTAAEAHATCRRLFDDPHHALCNAGAALDARAEDLYKILPVFESDNRSLTAFYNRSMVHLLMNRWNVPDFVLNPYYGTGSVKGGCVCNYLWNFGEVWEILPLYDPAATREHIKRFLHTDLVTHFAFIPTTGEAFGPWYMVNQEKIIGLIYYYVKNTGDTAFLREYVDGKTILEWAIFHACVLDDAAKPVALIDYGPSNSHLELRRGFPYNHVMPDLNGRRYANYRMAAALCDWAGTPKPALAHRAESLKTLLKERLWDPETRWFRFEDGQGHSDTRYTIQIFKLFGSGVLDAEEEAGLLAHLNETEFLSSYGLHSMAKTDVAYDQVDIDNGGGGACTSFPPQIAERLYKSGHAREADDIMGRILWWGERMPYWSDSIVANAMDYRKDTPLQCMLDGAAIAQGIIFGLLGVDSQVNGDVTFNPHRPPFANRLALHGLRLHGLSFDLEVDGETFDVRAGAKHIHSTTGSPVQWLASEHAFRQGA